MCEVISRRRFLTASAGAGVGVAAGGLVLAACSEGSGSSGGSGSGSGSGDAPFAMARRFPTEVLVPGAVRLPVSLVLDGQVQLSGPDTLQGRIVDSAGAEVGTTSATRRDIDRLVAPYYPFRGNVVAPGLYTLRVDGDDGDGVAFEVFAADTVSMPHVGAVLQPFDTPTVDDNRGVEPYCSLTPQPCPLHAITLTEALQSGLPVVYMVGTPAHCQTGTCAPGLEYLTATHNRVGAKVSIVHADVFADNAGTVVAPAVNALGLSYEPVLYLCAPDGTIVDQLDGVWDQTEIDEAVDRLVQQFS